MAYAEIKHRLDTGEVLLLDGGVGTELERRGADMDPAAWCGVATLDNEELLTQIHVDYARAGSDVITANTFASSRVMLSAAGHGDDVVEINQRAVEAALRAKEQLAAEGRTVAVAGSLSHLMPMIPGTATVDPELVPTPEAVGDYLAGRAFKQGVAQGLVPVGGDILVDAFGVDAAAVFQNQPELPGPGLVFKVLYAVAVLERHADDAPDVSRLDAGIGNAVGQNFQHHAVVINADIAHPHEIDLRREIALAQGILGLLALSDVKIQ